MPERQMTPEEREQFGRDWFEYTMTSPAPPPSSPYYKAGIANFVFAEMWSRPGLTMKERRLITLACVGAADTQIPIKSHVYAAMKTGDLSYEEMHEFVLQFAVYLGWPKASIMQSTIDEQWQRIQDEGGTVQMKRPERPGA